MDSLERWAEYLPKVTLLYRSSRCALGDSFLQCCLWEDIWGHCLPAFRRSPRGIKPCLTSSLIEGDSMKAIVHTDFQALWCFDRNTVDKIASNWPHSEVGQSHLLWLHNCPPLAPFWVLPLVVTAALFTSAVYLARITILKKRLFPLFKCLITCAVHFEVLTFDAFPMAQSRFVSRCGRLA